MNKEAWEFTFGLLGALGSLATFGAFMFMLRKDKAKQAQLDKLTQISATWAKLYEVEKKKHQAQLVESKMQISPELRIHSQTQNARDHELQIINNGETAIVESIQVDPPNSVFLENRRYPFLIDKQGKVSLKFTETGMTHIADITIAIYYADKAYNGYFVSYNQGTLSMPKEIN